MALWTELGQTSSQRLFTSMKMRSCRTHHDAILQTHTVGMRNIERQQQFICPMCFDVKATVQGALAKMRERLVQGRNLREQKGRTTGEEISAAADPAMLKAVVLDVLAVRSSDSASPSTASL